MKFNGENYFEKSIIAVGNFFLLFFSPFYVLKIPKFKRILLENESELINHKEQPSQILFRLNSEVQKNIIKNFTFKYHNNRLEFEVKSENNFLFTLTEPRKGIFSLEPYNYLIATAFKMSGTGKFENLANQLGSSSGFGRYIFYLDRIYPYCMKKEINIFIGRKFNDGLQFYPLVILLFSTITTNISWFKKTEKSSSYKFLQICNLKQSKIKTIRILFEPLNCSIYLSISFSSSLTTFRILFDRNKNFCKFESLGKIEDSLVLQLSDIYWGGSITVCLIGGFIDGKILIWNEILQPIIQFVNCNYSVINFGNDEEFSGYIFVLKKNIITSKEKKKKNCLKFITHTILSELNVSKYMKTENLNKNWQILNMKNLKNFRETIKNKLEQSGLGSPGKDFFFQINRLALFLVNKEDFKLYIIKKFIKFIKYLKLKTNQTHCYFFNNKQISSKLEFYFFIIGKRRNLTSNEIKSEQLLTNFRSKKFCFKYCPICLRIWKINIEKMDKLYCPFTHPFKRLGSERETLTFPKFKNFKYNLESSEEEYSIYSYPIFKSLNKNHYYQNNFLQKELNWSKLFRNLYNS